jgi:meckelin
MVFEA